MNLADTSERSLTAIVEQAAVRLRAALPELDARREAEALVLRCLQLPRSALFVREESLSADELARIELWLARRATGEPLAYLCGEREFWSLPLQVDARVLVPRPETELLVEHALQHGDRLEDFLEHTSPQSAGRALRVLDLGTGSGAIALAIASERPDWQVTAIDRSAEALQVARGNAARLALQSIEFLQGDWFTPLAGRRFELILANPPYVAADDPLLQGDSLRHEPRGALTPGEDALADLRRIIAAAPEHLSSGGVLLLEHGAAQGAAVRTLLEARGFGEVRSLHDLAGLERASEGRAS